jgi:hypothetical protein
VIDQGLIRLTSLFFFSAASFGFVLFMLKYPRGSEVRIWGIRLCHVLGFLGMIFLRLSEQQFNEISVMIFVSLVISLIGFELAEQFLKGR